MLTAMVSVRKSASVSMADFNLSACFNSTNTFPFIVENKKGLIGYVCTKLILVTNYHDLEYGKRL